MQKYRVLESIGSGTYGRVYKVQRLVDNVFLVLKQIPFGGIPASEQSEVIYVYMRLHGDRETKR